MEVKRVEILELDPKPNLHPNGEPITYHSSPSTLLLPVPPPHAFNDHLHPNLPSPVKPNSVYGIQATAAGRGHHFNRGRGPAQSIPVDPISALGFAGLIMDIVLDPEQSVNVQHIHANCTLRERRGQRSGDVRYRSHFHPNFCLFFGVGEFK
jgi:hypothetical protein